MGNEPDCLAVFAGTPKSPHICFSWRDERNRQHQQSTGTADPAEASAFKLQFLREKREIAGDRKVLS